MHLWIAVLVTLFISGDVIARRDQLWDEELSKTQQLEAIETMLKIYQGERSSILVTICVFHGIIIDFYTVSS